MNKEQLLELIKLLPIKELNGFKIYYYSEEKADNVWNHDKREEHNINYGLDYDQLTLKKIDKMNDTIRELQRTIDELQSNNIN